MRFVVLASKQYLPWAEMCFATIRHWHKDAQIIHMGNPDTPMPELADGAWYSTDFEPKRPQRFIKAKTQMLADMGDEPTVILDADTLVTAKLDEVWEQPFDVALTVRKREEQPYNSGVMFSRCTAFWKALLARQEAHQHYCLPGGDQEALAREARSGKWNLLELSCNEWNNSGMTREHALKYKPSAPRAKVLHYKGRRRDWMKLHFEAELWKKEGGASV